METTYNGNDIFAPFNAGLYGYDDINWDESKENILEEFTKEFEIQIRNKLTEFGLEFVKLKYHSPKYYNYNTDSIDLTLKINDQQILREKLETIRPQFIQAMKDNKAYDSYMPLTTDDWEEIIDKGQLSILAVTEILKPINFSRFDISELLVWDYNEALTCANEECNELQGEEGEICDKCFNKR